MYSNLNREDLEIIRKIVAEQLGPKIDAIVNQRMDKLQDQLQKVEKIDRIISDIKSLFS